MKQWNEIEVQNYIDNQIEENLNLDYKAADSLGKSDSKKKEISKDVSAMANSNGGLIIYGIKEYNEKDKNHLPEKIDPVNRVDFSKEWIEQIINTNIFPRIEGVKIQSIQICSGENDVVYVVDVPKSDTAHQAGDLRYYKRFNFESVPMYDYEVRDVMNRNKTPKLDVSIVHEIERIEKVERFPMPNYPLMPFGREQKKPKEYWEYYRLHVKIINIGNLVARFVKLKVKVPDSLLKKDEYSYEDQEVIDKIVYRIIDLDNTTQDIVDTEYVPMGNPKFKYGPKRFSPILPTLEFGLYITLKEEQKLPTGKIYWKVFADNSTPREGIVNIEEIETKEIEK